MDSNVIPNKTIAQMKNEFDNIVKQYLETNPVIRNNRKNNELEIRFGTNGRLARPISKLDYDNVIKQLYSCGFKCENNHGSQILRIMNEYVDSRTGRVKMSNVRAEIVGADLIQEYCRTNSIQSVINMPSTLFNKLKFTKKATATNKDGTFINRLDMDDFNFRVSFQTEEDFNMQSPLSQNIVSKWNDSKKLFRCMNRVRFYHPDYPVFADLSIVKSSSKTRNKVPLPEYTIQDANLFNNIESYEIELEVDNARVGTGTPFNTHDALLDSIRKCIRIILSGLQGTKFPISYKDQESVLNEYMTVVHGEHYQKRRIMSSDFIGPSSYTLQLDNIVQKSENSDVPNIRANYTVTDKADGERKLLYISETGKIYMIDTNMNVIFTGTKTTNKDCFHTIIDGEHIKYNKKGEFINLYAAFDIYYYNKKGVRGLAFIRQTDEDDTRQYRLELLKQYIDILKPMSILEKGSLVPNDPIKSSEYVIVCKNFKVANESKTIFEGCSEILSNIKDGTYEYNTDGLIFTPSDLPVGGSKKDGSAGKLSKITWEHSFKWKPAEFNTIDFLVSMKKDKTGKDEIHNVFKNGRNLQGVQDVEQYKTIILHCGFNQRTHGYINPCQDVLNDVMPSEDDIDNESKYKPVPFVPTNPYDPNACYCNILMKEDGTKLFMTTEEGDAFEDDMIVEFKYVIENEDGWKWVPIRVRYDKTAELRAKGNNFGNAYHVANNNWYSIHHPITEDMMSTGNNIPEAVSDSEVYYNRSNEETSTQALRDFHNLYVKKNLIVGVSKRDDTLVDFAVGKAGDLKKWSTGNLSFVFGVDVSKDNIHNQLDGACARYLNEQKRTKNIHKALFVVGDSALNIRSGQAFVTEKDKQITKAVFGNGPKDLMLLGKGVYNQYGIAEKGFNISSCQFALHYFFKNATSFHGFLRNIAECTRLNGHFIGTCYDGKTVFELLKKLKNGESITIMKDERKIYEVIKRYDQTGFPDEDMSLGYSIDVFQESINQYFREYLVNFDYFIRIMEDYGFVLSTNDEARHMGLPSSTGMFSELFNSMENEIRQNPKKKANYRYAHNMSPEERRISFMNLYFVFKKVRDVDVKKMSEVILKENALIERVGEENIKEIESAMEEMRKPDQGAQVIKKKKLVLKKADTIRIGDEKMIIQIKK